ncbi:AhpC-TSA-domain-containing protein [Powellomyces hirtus]|nr:AhpC-TSA-domain-containing protein [Powellomyces hirtus]
MSTTASSETSRRSARLAARPGTTAPASAPAAKSKKATATTTTEKKPAAAAKKETEAKKPQPKRKAVADDDGKEKKTDEQEKEEGKEDADEEAPEGNVAPAAVKAPAKKKAKSAVLKKGDAVPDDLSVENQKGDKVKILDLVTEQGAVFFMYPRADTPGCTKQAQGFKENYAEFEKKGYAVYGLSADKPAAQLKWQTKLSLPYDLLSDTSFATIGAFGAHQSPNKIIRSHVVVGKGGKVEDVQIKVSPSESFEGACKFVKKE